MSGPDRQRRKALIDAYRKTPRQMGVYRIVNCITGRALVAASRDPRARLNRHRMNLKTGMEAIAELQHDWNTLGPDAFRFEILDLLEPLDDATDPTDDLATLEALWLEKLDGTVFYPRR